MINRSTIAGLAGTRRIAVTLAAAALFFGSVDVVGQSTPVPPANARSVTTQTGPIGQTSGAEILSDTQGVDFGPYLRQALSAIKRNWLPLLPEEARPPASQQAETLIRFKISPDGKISSMNLDGSSRQIKMDRAAWGAIKSIEQLPPLPAAFKGPYLELRIDFRVNQSPAVAP